MPPTEPSLEPSDVPATIYLNERLVLDMLASLQDGFAQSVRVDRVRADSGTRESEASAGASVPVLSLVGLNIGGRVKRDASQSDTQTQSVERTHTVSSLFSLLRSELRQRNLVVELRSQEDLATVRPGMFLESVIRTGRNGFVEVIRAVKAAMEISASVAKWDRQPRPPSGAGRNTADRTGQGKQNAPVMQQMDWLLSKAKPGRFEDLVGVVLSDPAVHLVMPVDLDLFFDSSLSEALNSDLRVLGKVTRVLKGEADQINLFRGTELGTLKPKLWKTVMDSVRDDDLREAVSIPDQIEVVVSAPGVQVIPIALFA